MPALAKTVPTQNAKTERNRKRIVPPSGELYGETAF
jgi:hypothetical protein